MHNVDTSLMHSEPGIEKYYMQGGKQWQLLSAAFVKNIGCGWVVALVAMIYRDGDPRNLHEWIWHMETDHPHIMNVVIPTKM